MAFESMDYRDHFPWVMEVLTSRGLLLTSNGPDGRPNPMTIGWGSLGSVWGVPIWQVLVRPSRYTYECIETSGDFTVNVPPSALTTACGVCGTRSGRDLDKMDYCRLSPLDPTRIESPGLAECAIVYECKVVHCNDVDPPALAERIRGSAYASGDYHRIYLGQIVAVRSDPALIESVGDSA